MEQTLHINRTNLFSHIKTDVNNYLYCKKPHPCTFFSLSAFFSEILARKILTPFQTSCEYLHYQTACPENFYDRKKSIICLCCIKHGNTSFLKEVKDCVLKENISSVLAVEYPWVKRHKLWVRQEDTGGKACHFIDLGPEHHGNVLKIYHLRKEV